MQLIIRQKKWFALAGIVGFSWACKEGLQSKDGAEYYYFPEKNMYYDASKEMYLFSLDSGKTWDSLQNPLDEIPPLLGKKEVMYSSSTPLWANNETHLAQFKGKQFNVINEESLRPVAKRDVKTVSANQSTSRGKQEKNTKKRPLKKFFAKIFGKKTQA